MQAGDELKLVERKWPKWTIERIQEYLHRNLDDLAANEELAAIKELGSESRNQFKSRVAKQKARERRAAGEDNKERWRAYRITEKKKQTERVSSFVLEANIPDFSDSDASNTALGSYVRLKLPNGLLRSYSIVSGNANRFELGIALEENSRGGSKYLHETATEGDCIQVGRITSDIKADGISNHVFIVGGIGITAFLSLMELYLKIHLNFELHYGIRSASDIPFRERIQGLGTHVKLYDASRGGRMDIPAILKGLPWNSFVYVCGPQRLLDEAMREAKANGLGDDEIHFEAFAADTTGDPFDVEVVNRPGTTLHVEGEETLLEVLRRQFGTSDVPSSCEVGNCGTCKIGLRSGKVDHRGTALSEDDKKCSLLSCVSRGIGKISVEI